MVRAANRESTRREDLLMSGLIPFDAVMRLLRLPHAAGDLMTPNPVSLNENVSVREAAAFLTRRRISAAPVINNAGRPVGVLSQSDIVRQAARDPAILDSISYAGADDEESFLDEIVDRGNLIGRPREARGLAISEIMTPYIYCVRPETPVVEVVRELLAHNVHRLFVTDEDGVLIGVITALDILRCLRR